MIGRKMSREIIEAMVALTKAELKICKRKGWERMSGGKGLLPTYVKCFGSTGRR
jgi:hypothetical protein